MQKHFLSISFIKILYFYITHIDIVAKMSVSQGHLPLLLCFCYTLQIGAGII